MSTEAHTPTQAPGGRPTATWDLEEFTAHQRRLQRVSMMVDQNRHQLDNAVAATPEAFGMLFGWAINPFIGKLANSTDKFSDVLATSLDASAEAIKKSRDAYAEEEANAVASTAEVGESLNSAPGKVDPR